jgi:ATP-binding cassette subfamily B protein
VGNFPDTYIKGSRKGKEKSALDKQRGGRKTGFARLIEVAGSKRKYLVTAGLFGALGSIAKMTIYFFVYLVIAEIIKSGGKAAGINTEAILGIAAGAAIALAVALIFNAAGSISAHIAAFNLLYEIRMQLSKKLAQLPMGYFNTHSTGEIKKVMNEDVERIETFVAHNIMDFVSGIITPIVTLIFMFVVDWRMALAALVSLPVAMLAGRNLFSGKTNQELSDKYQKAMGKMNGSAVEYINGMPVVKTFAKGEDMFLALKEDILNSGKAALTWAKGLRTPYILFNTLLPASILFIFPISVLLVSNPASYETMLTAVLFFFVIGTNFAEPMKQLMLLSGVMRKVTFGMECIDDILLADEIAPGNQNKTTGRDVCFERVRFAYGDSDILKDVSFTCRAGEVTALVGPSGAGKSTIAQLMARFWDVREGCIKIGEQDIREYTNEALMDTVSFVFQDVVMLSDTIEENIRMGNKAASIEEVKNAARTARIHDFIELLPQGYLTKIGEEGVYLSGGEQQRISIARVILKNTPIVILDEATAYADAENEAMIQQAFAALAKDKTVIVVAHRLQSIADADQILVFNQGTLMECGTQNTLLDRNGLYAHMWKTMTSADSWTLNQKMGAFL